MGLELTTDKYPPITSQTRYPLRHAASNLVAYVALPNRDYIFYSHIFTEQFYMCKRHVL